MYELSVQTVFSGAHALSVRGEREAVHGHDWHVTATVAGAELDADGLLVDFHELERVLAEIVRPWRNADLNGVPPFDRVNPSAENVARHIGTELERRMGTGSGVRVESVRVTEAPGCAATYRPDLNRGGRVSDVGVGRGPARGTG